ncbi:MAG TPA: hypothetical protein VNT81_20675 [Vicinamibacterales bacterium]|nr:hypothetical protein [Vicinamibacterales bacterium]
MRTLIVALLLAAQSPGPVFRFETDGFWLNMHHFLYVLGRAQNNERDVQRRAVINAPADSTQGLAGQSDRDRRAWEDAIAFYANGLSKLDTVFSAPLIEVTNALRVAPDAAAASLKVDPALHAVLQRAAPVYRAVWWNRHRAANRERVRALTTQVSEHGDQILAFITRAYLESWPKDGYPINVSGYSNWAGAYSTSGDLLVVSSLDEGSRGPMGLEIVFHEAMHQWDQKMMTRLTRLSKQHQTAPPRGDITHALIWYTAAEAVKRVIPAHVGYAESGGLWKQKGLGAHKVALDAHWKPYLDGKGTLDEALLGLLKS